MKDFVKVFFDGIWSLFSIEWPGTNFPIGYAFLGVSFAILALRLFASLFDSGVGSAYTGFVRGGNNSIRKISSNRKDDVK